MPLNLIPRWFWTGLLQVLPERLGEIPCQRRSLGRNLNVWDCFQVLGPIEAPLRHKYSPSGSLVVYRDLCVNTVSSLPSSAGQGTRQIKVIE